MSQSTTSSHTTPPKFHHPIPMHQPRYICLTCFCATPTWCHPNDWPCCCCHIHVGLGSQGEPISYSSRNPDFNPFWAPWLLIVSRFGPTSPRPQVSFLVEVCTFSRNGSPSSVPRNCPPRQCDLLMLVALPPRLTQSTCCLRPLPSPMPTSISNISSFPPWP